MKFQSERYSRYKQALYTASNDRDFADKHPDFALTHARVFYDDLRHEGYKWYAEAGVWSKTPPKKEHPTKPSKSPTRGLPATEVFKVRIVAHIDQIDSLVKSTRTLYDMLDCEVLSQSKVKVSRWDEKSAIVFFIFRLPR